MTDWINDIKNFLTLDENKILTIGLYGEARGEGWEGIIAVLNVMRNRVNQYSRYHSKDLEQYGKYLSVILKKWQFSCFLSNDPNRVKLETIAKDFSWYAEHDGIINKIYFLCSIKQHLMDNTGGATHYFTTSITPPDWSHQMTKLDTIGHHIFFKE